MRVHVQLSQSVVGAAERGEWSAMGGIITDEMIDTIAVHGTPDQVAEEITRRYGSFAADICAYFPYYDAGDDLIADFTDALKATRA